MWIGYNSGNICNCIWAESVFELWLDMSMDYKPHFFESFSLSLFTLAVFLSSSPPMSPLGGNNTPWLNNLHTQPDWCTVQNIKPRILQAVTVNISAQRSLFHVHQWLTNHIGCPLQTHCALGMSVVYLWHVWCVWGSVQRYPHLFICHPAFLNPSRFSSALFVIPLHCLQF